MAAIPYWGDDPDEGEDPEARSWDFCWLGDDFLPGLSTVKVSDNGREIQKKKSKGKVGATLTDNGVGPATVTITLRIWTSAQYAAWLPIRKRIDPKNPGAIRAPTRIRHPETDEAQIKGVYVTQIEATPPTANGRTYTITCTEWFPQPKDVKATQKIKEDGAATNEKKHRVPGETIQLTGVEGGLEGLDLGTKDPNEDAIEDDLRKRALDDAAAKELANSDASDEDLTNSLKALE